MAVISEVKCGRCDRRYSGFRSRCPYCGARRNKRGKHADESDNAKAKLVIGVILLVLLIAATMVLILTRGPDTGEEGATDSAPITSEVTPTYSDDEGVSGVDNTDDANASPSVSPSPSAQVEIAEVTITYLGDPRVDLTMDKVGDSLQMGFSTIPETTDKAVTWASSDEAVFMVLSDGKITATGKGAATLTATVDGIEAKCTVRVRGV